MPVDYFAYASNMDPAVMAERCPSYTSLGPALLEGYELAFTRRSRRSGTGVADIVPAPGSVVWGVLYEVDDACLESLDRKEGRGWAYERVTVPVTLEADGSVHEAQSYSVVTRESEPVAPSAAYLDGLISAAETAELPDAYVTTLRAFKDAAAFR
jgi:gamma-glutamylcyclotransferase